MSEWVTLDELNRRLAEEHRRRLAQEDAWDRFWRVFWTYEGWVGNGTRDWWNAGAYRPSEADAAPGPGTQGRATTAAEVRRQSVRQTPNGNGASGGVRTHDAPAARATRETTGHRR